MRNLALWFSAIVLFIAGLLLSFPVSRVLAHDLPGIPKEHQAWYSNAETTLEARKRLPWSKCCNHAEVTRTQFRVNKTDNGDEWYAFIADAWVRIPRDIIHPEGEHAPDHQPTLFIYQGKMTCFFLGEGGI